MYFLSLKFQVFLELCSKKRIKFEPLLAALRRNRIKPLENFHKLFVFINLLKFRNNIIQRYKEFSSIFNFFKLF